jgi:uncharacterized protein
MKKKQLTPLVMSVLLVAFAGGCAKKEPPRLTRLLVTGESDLKEPPDTAVVVLSVVTQNKAALEAQQQNARKSNAVMQAVREAAGASPEVETSDYSLQPQRDWMGSMPRIVGYEARNSVTVRTGTLDNVGALIDAATRAGANSVESVNFVLRESNPARGRTLSEATKQAMTKARSMAEALGGRVVRVVEEQEGGFVNRPTTAGELEERMTAYANANTALYREEAAKMSPRTPVKAGDLNVKSQVQIIVEVEARP